jgi:hypothetical protein
MLHFAFSQNALLYFIEIIIFSRSYHSGYTETVIVSYPCTAIALRIWLEWLPNMADLRTLIWVMVMVDMEPVIKDPYSTLLYYVYPKQQQPSSGLRRNFVIYPA